MAKYSDLLGRGSSSPSNYFEMLARLRGDIPLNVFATIANACSLETADPLTQASLENELLSESLRRKLARFREKKPVSATVAFTASGALLNLRLLLAQSAMDDCHSPTAIGACALHANDYVESQPDGKLSRGLLPVVSEFAATSELYNPRNWAAVLRRAHHIFTRFVLPNEEMKRLYRDECRQELDEVHFSGLTYERFLPFVFGLHTVVRRGVLDKRTSILVAEDVAEKAGVTVDEFRTFAASKVMTFEDARREFGPVDGSPELTKLVMDAAWVSDLGAFRRRPLISLPDGRYLVPSMQFLLENASAGLAWNLREPLSRKGGDLFFTYWGSIFETYTQDLLAHYFGGSVHRSIKYARGDVDVAIELLDAVLLFECKSGSIRQDAKGSRDTQTFGDALSTKFVVTKDGAPKGIRQLARAAHALKEGGIPEIALRGRPVCPILVAEDPVMQTFAMNAYLDTLFREEIGADEAVAPLTLMTIDELEEVLPSIRAGDIGWRDLFESRFVPSGVVVNPMHTSYADLMRERALAPRPDTFLKDAGAELGAMMKAAFAGVE